jgi:DNA-directed RNA polymerase subunit RPC12/RpoP
MVMVLTERQRRGVVIGGRDDVKQSNGSIFHWSEVFKVTDHNPSGTRHPRYVPVTCGSGKSPRCRGKRPAVLLKDWNQPLLWGPESTNLRGGDFIGYCNACFSLEYRPNQVLPEGSRVLWEERDAAGVPAVCGKCKTQQLLECDISVKVEDREWVCTKCGHGIGVEEHPTGATILWLKRGRHNRPSRSSRKRQQDKTPFGCARCREESAAWAHAIRASNWSGLCEVCRRERGHPRKQTQDRTLPTGAICLYSQRGQRIGRAGSDTPVLCGLPVSETERCRKRNNFNFDVTKRDTFSGYCPTHSTVEIATLLMRYGAALAAVEQNAAKPAKAQRKLDEVKDEICALWLAEGKRFGAVTYEEIARRLQRSGKESKYIGPKAVAKRFNRAGYTGERADVVLRVLREKGLL